MSTKYYRVKQNTFMWLEGAILSDANMQGRGYQHVEDVWNKVPLKEEYISSHIIENDANADTFERVYPSKADKMLFVTKEELKKAYKKFTS